MDDDARVEAIADLPSNEPLPPSLALGLLAMYVAVSPLTCSVKLAIDGKSYETTPVCASFETAVTVKSLVESAPGLAKIVVPVPG